MAKKTHDGYMCTICEKVYPTPAKADSCRDSHEIVYIPMTRTELNRLINAIFLENFSVIPESLITTLKKVQQVRVTDAVQEKMPRM